MLQLLCAAAGGALLWAVFTKRKERRSLESQQGPGYTGDACVAGIRRARRHRVMLRGGVGEDGDVLEPLPLDVCIASPPKRHHTKMYNGSSGNKMYDGDDDNDDEEGGEDVVVLYVLDPEPLLFGAAALFAFAQAAYGSTPDSVESVFRRMHVVGVGHAAGSYGLDGAGLDTAALRQAGPHTSPLLSST